RLRELALRPRDVREPALFARAGAFLLLARGPPVACPRLLVAVRERLLLSLRLRPVCDPVRRAVAELRALRVASRPVVRPCLFRLREVPAPLTRTGRDSSISISSSTSSSVSVLSTSSSS